MSDVYEIRDRTGWVCGLVRWDERDYVVIEPYRDADWNCRVDLGSVSELDQVIAALTALRQRLADAE